MNYENFTDIVTFNRHDNTIDMNKIKENISKNRKKLNILIMGQSGVGKSTLVNAMFGKDVAETGVGEPKTTGIERFEIQEKGLTLWDTRGIEAKDYEKTMGLIKTEINNTLNSLDKDKAPHIAWLCVKEGSSRIEDREKELIKMTENFGIPTIVVFTDTQSPKGDEFFEEGKRIIDEKFSPFIKDKYVRVNSIPTTLDHPVAGKIVFPPIGLKELEELTYSCLAEADANLAKAFAKIQKANNIKRLAAMKDDATSAVNWASAAAGVAGASPIPGSDAPIIAGIQSTMIYKINSSFEVDLNTTATTTLVTGILGVTGIATIAKAVVGNLIKFIPGVGSVIGAGISGTAAAAITKAIGEAYIAVLAHYYDEETGDVKLPSEVSTILDIFTKYFKK